MEVLVMQVFISLLLVLGALVLLAYSLKQADHEHADRLSLFPMEDDARLVVAPPPSRGRTTAPNPDGASAAAGDADTCEVIRARAEDGHLR